MGPQRITADGGEVAQRQLPELLLLQSGNNVARLLARWDAGSQEAFVAKMNRTAADLGMTRTAYTGASGFEATTKSTADDQLKLARQAMQEPVLRAVVAMRSTTIPGVPGTVTNTNRLLEKPAVIGLKTGSSAPAGGNLMWAAEVKTATKQYLVLGVVMGQRANTTPTEGPMAALSKSAVLIEAVQNGRPTALGTSEGAAARPRCWRGTGPRPGAGAVKAPGSAGGGSPCPPYCPRPSC
ncbi:D-alanyl-D-alanine carboxypeptidase family protein [Streptomyces sp. NPDC056835]|uniref:D-alanyl-D-alanine carboxypeptidase family protein n=1 Tax=Streptomyces sp. NPDC056835 TaxID=3345956 RepID=UPI0036AD5532